MTRFFRFSPWVVVIVPSILWLNLWLETYNRRAQGEVLLLELKLHTARVTTLTTTLEHDLARLRRHVEVNDSIAASQWDTVLNLQRELTAFKKLEDEHYRRAMRGMFR